jgi:hypothetical protein
MTIDPFIGVLLGLAGSVVVGLASAWLAGLFDAPPPRNPYDVAAE